MRESTMSQGPSLWRQQEKDFQVARLMGAVTLGLPNKGSRGNLVRGRARNKTSKSA